MITIINDENRPANVRVIINIHLINKVLKMLSKETSDQKHTADSEYEVLCLIIKHLENKTNQ